MSSFSIESLDGTYAGGGGVNGILSSSKGVVGGMYTRGINEAFRTLTTGLLEAARYCRFRRQHLQGKQLETIQ